MLTRAQSRPSIATDADGLNPATIFLLPKSKLKEELQNRGLDTHGNKEELAIRLDEHIQLARDSGYKSFDPSPIKFMSMSTTAIGGKWERVRKYKEHYGQQHMESSSSSVHRGIGHPPQLQQQSNMMNNSKSPMDQLTRNIDRTIHQVQQTAIKQQQVTPFQWSSSCSPNEQLSIPLQIQMRNRRTVKPQQQFAIGTGHSHQVKGAGGGEDGQQRQDRFKYFGTFVESAVRDLHQQSPELARHLMQSIYSTVSAHQMEATAGIGVDFGGGGNANSGSGGSGGWINGSG